MRLATLGPVLCSLLLFPLAARAAGKHDAVGCAGCHGKKDVMAGNVVYVDPATKKPYTGSTAVCFSCHQARDAGGKGLAPVWRHDSHPFGLETVNPKVARVPAAFLVKGRFECMSCHDPHPSNPNYKYLRADVGPKGQNMDRFCVLCHLTKG